MISRLVAPMECPDCGVYLARMDLMINDNLEVCVECSNCAEEVPLHIETREEES